MTRDSSKATSGNRSRKRVFLLSIFVLAVLVVAVIWRGEDTFRKPEAGRTNQSPSRATEPERQRPSAATEALPWERPELAADRTRVLAGDSVETIPSRIAAYTVGQRQIDDPTRDGWDTEVWSSLADKQLKKLTALLIDSSKLDVEHIAAIVAEDFVGPTLRPAGAVQVYEDARMRVLRLGEEQLRRVKGEHRGPQGFLDAARSLTERIADAPGARTKIKTFGVEAQRDALITRVYFSASTRNGFEHHATWDCRWSLAAEDVEPQLQGISLLDFEEIHSTLADSVLFADCTASLLEANPCYQEQLVPGIHRWLKSIDISVDPDFEGMQGLAIGDVNGDDLEDIYMCQGGGLPNRLFIHRPDGRLSDVSAEAGVDWMETTRSALFVDLDNDGDQDLVLAPNDMLMIMSNDGTGRFTEQARFTDLTLAFSLTAADYDRDGDLDLYACRHFSEAHKAVGQLPNPVPYHDANNGGRNVLLRNDGGWAFSDVTVESGLDVNNRRWSYAAAWEDYDNDGDLDLYVSNDFGRNNLYRNEGGSFRDVAAEAGVEDIASGMSTSWGDYNGDGLMDLYVSNMFSSAGGRITYQRNFKSDAPAETKAYYQRLARGNSLFQNLGNGSFTDVSTEAAVTMGRWAWASKFVDLNNDGRQDLVVANGYVTGEDSGDL